MLFNLTLGGPLPWLKRGHTVIACDTQHPHYYHETRAHGGLYITTNAPAGSAELEAILWAHEVRLCLSFAPCTDLAVSGAAHFEKKKKANPNFQSDAVELATLAPLYCSNYMVENPISVLATLWRKPDYYFDPCEYGGYLPLDDVHPQYPSVLPPKDAYKKRTCLWTGGGFIMPPKDTVEPRGHDFPGFLALCGKSLRTKNIRSATPRGFSEALCIHNEHLLGAQHHE